MNFIGQPEIKFKIDNLTIDTCANSNIIVGEQGSGKHTICNLISDTLQLNLYDITKKLTLDTITDIYLRTEPAIYTIDGNDLSEKNNNTILKLLEEPPKNAFIFILINSEKGVLPTIINRCYIWKLKPYSSIDLIEFIPNTFDYETKKLILTITKTPGQIINLCETDPNKIIDYANYILDKITVASFSNVLNISDKVYYDTKADDKFSCFILCNLLVYILRKRIAQDYNEKYVNAHNATCKLITALHMSNFNKKYLFENYLFTLKRLL